MASNEGDLTDGLMQQNSLMERIQKRFFPSMTDYSMEG